MLPKRLLLRRLMGGWQWDAGDSGSFVRHSLPDESVAEAAQLLSRPHTAPPLLFADVLSIEHEAAAAGQVP